MAKFHTFIGKVKNGVKDNGPLLERICEDIDCKNFREARSKAVALYKETEATKEGVFALVVCEDCALLIGSGIRPASVKNFGNGYSVDVTPSLRLPITSGTDIAHPAL